MAYHIDISLADAKLGPIEDHLVGSTMRLVSDYSAGDSLATVTSRTLADYTLLAGDVTGPTGATDRTITIAPTPINMGPADTGDAAPANLHVTIDDGSIVQCATNVANQPITQGNPVIVGTYTITDNQPVLAP